MTGRRSGRRILLLGVTALFALGLVAACGEPEPPPPPPPPAPPAPPPCTPQPLAATGWFAVTEDPAGGRAVERLAGGTVAERQDAVGRIEASGRRVVSLEPDAVVTTAEVTDPVFVGPPSFPTYGPSGQWGVRTAGFPTAWLTATGQGLGVRVGVIDTGVQGDHPDLTGAVVAGADFVAATDGRSDPNGHGTHVAGIVAARADGIGGVGGAPAATVVPVRVLGPGGSGSMADVVAGIYWAVDTGAATVLNLSLAGPASASLSTAVGYAVGHGVVVVAAAGNSGCSVSVAYPGGYAATAGVLAVGSTDAADQRSSFSSTGSHVSIAAPGSGIWSTVPTSTWGLKSGTSMASPMVAAAAALLRGRCPALTPAQVEARLEATALDLAPAGPDTAFGAGRLRADAAVAGAC